MVGWSLLLLGERDCGRDACGPDGQQSGPGPQQRLKDQGLRHVPRAPPTVPGQILSPGQIADTFRGDASPGATAADGLRGNRAAHLQVSPAMKSKMAPMSSLFQKSLKYRSAIFISPNSSGS